MRFSARIASASLVVLFCACVSSERPDDDLRIQGAEQLGQALLDHLGFFEQPSGDFGASLLAHTAADCADPERGDRLAGSAESRAGARPLGLVEGGRQELDKQVAAGLPPAPDAIVAKGRDRVEREFAEDLRRGGVIVSSRASDMRSTLAMSMSMSPVCAIWSNPRRTPRIP